MTEVEREELGYYVFMCKRKDIAQFLYDNKDPEGSFNKNYPNNPSKQEACEILDLGTYCKINGIDKEMLSQLDGESIGGLLSIVSHIKQKSCTAGFLPKDISPELMKKIQDLIEFEDFQNRKG